jgi:hypothetical protein
VPLTGSGLSLAGRLIVNPASIDFGVVTVGSTQDISGTITADGADVNMPSATWQGAGYSLQGTFPTTIKAGSSVLFDVIFTPQEMGSFPGQITFLSDAANSPTEISLTGSGAQPTSHSVSLSWQASDTQVAGYNIYRKSLGAGDFVRLNTELIAALEFTDSVVGSGVSYEYAATSVDSTNHESEYSNIATAVIP